MPRPDLQLLCQPAGSGKTYHCLRIFRQALSNQPSGFDRRSFFILPSREHVNRVNDLLLRDFSSSSAPLKGLIHPAVLTINEFLNHLAGISTANTPGDILRLFLIKSILAENPLEYYEAAKRHRGFAELAGDFIAETKASGISPEELEKLASVARETGPLFAKKMRDLALIFKTYDQKLRGFGLEEPEDLLKDFSDFARERARALNLDLVILDGFFHFSYAQKEFIRTLTRISQRVVVTLTLDKNADRGHVFAYPEETRQALLAMGFKEAGATGAKNHRAKAAPLVILERTLFSRASRPGLPDQAADRSQPELSRASRPGLPDQTADRSMTELSRADRPGRPDQTADRSLRGQTAVHIFEATGVSGEIEMIAREIRRLYREGAYHFSDFCLIFRNIGAYEEVVRAVFDSFRVPVEIHERKKLKQNAFIRAVVRWLRVLREGWRREDLFALLQSNYYGFDQEAVRGLEQKSLEEGVLEGAEAWAALCGQLGQAAEGGSERQARSGGSGRLSGKEKAVLEDLIEEHKKMSPARHPAVYKTLLLQWIARHGMVRRLARTSGPGLSEQASRDETREDFQAYRMLESILDEITLHRGSGSGEAVLGEYLDHLLAAIELSLFSVPVYEKNRVQVYDVVLALQKEYKVIFTAGLLEKNFPQRVLEDALLKDEERKCLNRNGARFEERLARSSGERFFFYMAVTRAKERLYLTYPRFDLEGKEALPSFYIEEVRHCLGEENIPVRKKGINQVVPLLEEIADEKDLFMILTQGLFEKNERNGHPAGPDLTGPPSAACSYRGWRAAGFYAELFNELVGTEDYLSVLKEAGRNEEKAEIRDPRILAWFKEHGGPFSATRLEAFATCPFRYFAEHVLGLKEKTEGIDRMELGSLIHKILQELYEEMAGPDLAGPSKKDWPLLARKEEVSRRALEKLEELFKTARFPGAKKSEQDLVRARLAETLTEWVEQEHKKELTRKTMPAYFEKRFGFKEKGALDYLRLKGPSGREVLIRGAIDRIDLDPETGAAVVIDYKSGAYKADKLMDHLAKGIELQIPIYLLAAEKLLGLKPAGGELYPVMQPARRRGIYDAPAMAKIAEISSRSSGQLDGPGFRGLLEAVEKKIPEYVERLQKGDIAVRSKACGECPYEHLCRFEKWKLIYSEEEKVWEKPAR